jgi:hypothetical protein
MSDPIQTAHSLRTSYIYAQVRNEPSDSEFLLTGSIYYYYITMYMIELCYLVILLLDVASELKEVQDHYTTISK